MDPDPPAGCFSTFFVADPSRSTLDGPSRPHRRNRRVFVCIPCHRRKLKRDKGQPCSRCVVSEAPDECVYQPYPGHATRRDASTDSRDTPRQSAQSSPRAAVASISGEGGLRTRMNGVTHWSTIAFELQEAWPYIFGTDPA